MKDNPNPDDKPLDFYLQALYFLDAAAAVTKDAQNKKDQNPSLYKQNPILINYEFVIIGTHHAFASELLLKGILLSKGIPPPKGKQGHNLSFLLGMSEISTLKNKIIRKFIELPLGHIDRENEMYANHNSQHSPASFDYYLDFHANHFVEIRYACDIHPKGLDMNFTSFLCNELKNELKDQVIQTK